MKTMPAALKSYLDAGGNITFRADLISITLLNGTVLRWTTCETSLTVGGSTYLTGPSASAPMIVGRSTLSSACLPTVGQMSITLVGGDYRINGQSLTLAAAGGYFDGARGQIDHLMGPDMPAALSWGPIVKLFEGRIGAVSPQGDNLTVPIVDEAIALRKMLPIVVLTPGCAWSVYDTNCAISAATFTLSGSASGVPTTKTIPTTSAALTAKAAGYFDLGVLTFTSGALNGVQADVETWSGTVFTLALPLTAAPAAGDTFTVFPGCDLKRQTCIDKFANLVHWRGFNHIPSSAAGN